MAAPRRFLLRLVAAGLIALGASWVGSLLAVYLVSNRDRARPAQAIIVLGAAQYDGRPSPVLRARLDHAIALWRQGMAPRLIVTGGRRAGDRASEAGTGRRYAIANGVPDSAILMESEGTSTDESLRAAAALLAELERTRAEAAGDAAADDATGDDVATALAPAGTAPPHSAILVSDPFHMLRLGVLARRHGIVPYTSPTPTSPIAASRKQHWQYLLRESLKVPFILITEFDDEN